MVRVIFLWLVTFSFFFLKMTGLSLKLFQEVKSSLSLHSTSSNAIIILAHLLLLSSPMSMYSMSTSSSQWFRDAHRTKFPSKGIQLHFVQDSESQTWNAAVRYIARAAGPELQRISSRFDGIGHVCFLFLWIEIQSRQPEILLKIPTEISTKNVE